MKLSYGEIALLDAGLFAHTKRCASVIANMDNFHSDGFIQSIRENPFSV